MEEICWEEFKGNLVDYPERWEWNNDEYMFQAMDINYQVVKNDSRYFSVIFEGLYNHKNAAHPINYFNSLTIDLNEKKVVTLYDLYNIDMEFVKVVKKAVEEQSRQIGRAHV